ncbi:putative heterokaryon incompatibility protein [Rosellinia necatrix]|uniref:Putative heterokaryon incompatibility protein n=1 Tax=Rosellinia necatrix TaxID=77044 RepID=A0A1S7UI88_ROSNE|nr:putative heterokaryon incompatibility protein [Rosellinia necatrix]
MPMRLIEIGEVKDKTSARLVITRSLQIQAPYLALSYCWGTAVKSTVFLQNDNLENLQLGIDEERLPKSYTDTFQLARDLGYRYIWIDALCIIQDDREDWVYESRRMAQIYGNAALTIIAGRAAGCEEGFLENKLRHIVGPCAIPFYDEETKKQFAAMDKTGEMGHIWVSLPRLCDDGPVSKRGWCYQEAVLSSRALVFGVEQLHFRCQELEISEDGRVGRPPPFRLRNSSVSKHAIASSDLKPSEPLNKGQGVNAASNEELTRQWLILWYDSVMAYSARYLTDPADVFAAISGIAQIAKAKIRSRYLGGLWEADMVRGLLWKPLQVKTRFPPARRRQVAVSRQLQDDIVRQT